MPVASGSVLKSTIGECSLHMLLVCRAGVLLVVVIVS